MLYAKVFIIANLQITVKMSLGTKICMLNRRERYSGISPGDWTYNSKSGYHTTARAKMLLPDALALFFGSTGGGKDERVLLERSASTSTR